MEQHKCAHSECDYDATHVVIEGSNREKLFMTGAGLVCDDHTREYAQMGGVPMSITEFFEAASDRA